MQRCQSAHCSCCVNDCLPGMVLKPLSVYNTTALIQGALSDWILTVGILKEMQHAIMSQWPLLLLCEQLPA